MKVRIELEMSVNNVTMQLGAHQITIAQRQRNDFELEECSSIFMVMCYLF